MYKSQNATVLKYTPILIRYTERAVGCTPRAPRACEPQEHLLYRHTHHTTRTSCRPTPSKILPMVGLAIVLLQQQQQYRDAALSYGDDHSSSYIAVAALLSSFPTCSKRRQKNTVWSAKTFRITAESSAVCSVAKGSRA